MRAIAIICLLFLTMLTVSCEDDKGNSIHAEGGAEITVWVNLADGFSIPNIYAIDPGTKVNLILIQGNRETIAGIKTAEQVVEMIEAENSGE